MISDRNGLPIIFEAMLLLWQGKNAPDFDGDMEALQGRVEKHIEARLEAPKQSYYHVSPKRGGYWY